jgi:hypothetical protein
MHPNAKAVLEEHLPYELNMLQAAYEFLHKDDYADYRNVAFLKNAAIECFWMHARNLLDFLRQPKNTSHDAKGSVSAKDFTSKFDYQGIGDEMNDEINRAFTHLQYGRKSQPQKKPGTFDMLRVKEHIEREIGKFERALTKDYKEAWTPRARPEPIAITSGGLTSATNATTFATLLVGFPEQQRIE